MLHLFCACAVTSNLLQQFKLWVSDISLFGKTDIDPPTIIFGAWNLNMPDFILINHVILLSKRYIYLKRQDRHDPNITGLKSFIKNIETVERQIASNKNYLFTTKNGRSYCLSYTISWHELMQYNGECQTFNDRYSKNEGWMLLKICKASVENVCLYVLLMLPNILHPDYAFQFLAYNASSLLLPAEIRLQM